MPKENKSVSHLHAKYVGKRALLTVELSLTFHVKIKDAREQFGRVDLLVTPFESGSGEKWVSADRVAVQQ